ncbi:MAG: galactosyl transferase [Proteobacteria bacterium]|nr:galactosyl transferase [Pseudomonadota bacterium]
MPALTFLIPIRHPDNMRDKAAVARRLADTVRSIAQQENGDWRAVVVANPGTEIPPLPPRFETVWVDFPPNTLHQREGVDQETFYEAFRIDKGSRVLAGMLHARPTGHVMIVDDDDFVSNKLAGFVAEHPKDNGWYIARGYVWTEGSPLLYAHGAFSNLCGSSHIIRADLYQIPENFMAASHDYIKRMLGSHVMIEKHLEESGTALTALPFYGAIYRVNSSTSHSLAGGVSRLFFFNRETLRHPLRFLRRLFRLRLRTAAIRKEFYGV